MTDPETLAQQCVEALWHGGKATAILTRELVAFVAETQQEKETERKQQCPYYPHEHCVCAVTTRHEAYDWYKRERAAKEAAESALLRLREQIARAIPAVTIRNARVLSGKLRGEDREVLLRLLDDIQEYAERLVAPPTDQAGVVPDRKEKS